MTTFSYSLVIGYALLLFIGGFFGYYMSGSLISLIVSSLFAFTIFVALYLITLPSPFGWYLLSGTLSVLVLFFLYRFIATYKLMPAGIFFVLTAVLLFYLLKRFF